MNEKIGIQNQILDESYTINYKDLEFDVNENGERILLGEGAFGKVYSGQWQHSQVAIKELHVKKMTPEAQNEFISEVKVMISLHHDNVMELRGVSFAPYCMVMRFMPKGSLYDVLKSGQEFPWETRIQISIDIGAGLSHLHYKKIIHRDLKSLNVLLDEHYRAKVADFGLSQVKKESSSLSSHTTANVAGSLLWIAPELFQRRAKQNEASDIYSLGVTLWEVASRQLPFHDAANDSLIRLWVSQGDREDIPFGTPEIFGKLIEQAWAQLPTERPTADKITRDLKSAYSKNGKIILPNTNIILPQNIDKTLTIPPPTTTQSNPNYAIDDDSKSEKLNVSSEPVYAITSTKQTKSLPTIPQKSTVNSIPIYQLESQIKQNSFGSEQSKSRVNDKNKLKNSNEVKKTSSRDKSEKRKKPKDREKKLNSENNTISIKTSHQPQPNTVEQKQQAICDIQPEQKISKNIANSSEVNKGLSPDTFGKNSNTFFQQKKESDQKHSNYETLSFGIREEGNITNILVLPDGEFALIQGFRIKVWDNNKSCVSKVIEGYGAEKDCSGILSNGNVITGAGSQLCVLDITGGLCLKTLKIDFWIKCLSVLPNGNVFVAGDKLEVWDIEKGKCIRKLTTPKFYNEKNVKIETMINGGVIISYRSYEVLNLWYIVLLDVNKNKILRTLEVDRYINCILARPGGEMLIGTTRGILEWDINKKNSNHEFYFDEEHLVLYSKKELSSHSFSDKKNTAAIKNKFDYKGVLFLKNMPNGNVIFIGDNGSFPNHRGEGIVSINVLNGFNYVEYSFDLNCNTHILDSSSLSVSPNGTVMIVSHFFFGGNSYIPSKCYPALYRYMDYKLRAAFISRKSELQSAHNEINTNSERSLNTSLQPK